MDLYGDLDKSLVGETIIKKQDKFKYNDTSASDNTAFVPSKITTSSSLSTKPVTITIPTLEKTVNADPLPPSKLAEFINTKTVLIPKKPQPKTTTKKTNEYDPSKPNDYDKIKQAKRNLKKENFKLKNQKEPELNDFINNFIQQAPPTAPPASTVAVADTGEEAYLKRLELSKQYGISPEISQPMHMENQPDVDDDDYKDCEDIDGEDIDGEDIDGEDIDGEDIDGEAFEEDDLDGEPIEESPVILLLNMITKSDLDDTIEKETIEECGKYGKVVSVFIHPVT